MIKLASSLFLIQIFAVSAEEVFSVRDYGMIRSTGFDNPFYQYVKYLGSRVLEHGSVVFRSFLWTQTSTYDPTTGYSYLVDPNFHVVLEISPNSTYFDFPTFYRPVSGTRGRSGWLDSTRSKSLFNYPMGISLGKNRIYVADTENHAIRSLPYPKQGSNQAVSTIAGGPHLSGHMDGPVEYALLLYPTSLGNYQDERIFFLDNHSRVRMILNRHVITLVDGACRSLLKRVYPLNIVVREVGCHDAWNIYKTGDKTVQTFQPEILCAGHAATCGPRHLPGKSDLQTKILLTVETSRGVTAGSSSTASLGRRRLADGSESQEQGSESSSASENQIQQQGPSEYQQNLQQNFFKTEDPHLHPNYQLPIPNLDQYNLGTSSIATFGGGQHPYGTSPYQSFQKNLFIHGVSQEADARLDQVRSLWKKGKLKLVKRNVTINEITGGVEEIVVQDWNKTNSTGQQKKLKIVERVVLEPVREADSVTVSKTSQDAKLSLKTSTNKTNYTTQTNFTKTVTQSQSATDEIDDALIEIQLLEEAGVDREMQVKLLQPEFPNQDIERMIRDRSRGVRGSTTAKSRKGKTRPTVDHDSQSSETQSKATPPQSQKKSKKFTPRRKARDAQPSIGSLSTFLSSLLPSIFSFQSGSGNLDSSITKQPGSGPISSDSFSRQLFGTVSDYLWESKIKQNIKKGQEQQADRYSRKSERHKRRLDKIRGEKLRKQHEDSDKKEKKFETRRWTAKESSEILY